MKKAFIIFAIIIPVFIAASCIKTGICFQLIPQRYGCRHSLSLGGEVSDLGSVIFKNTKFKDAKVNNLFLQIPDWQQIVVDPMSFWPKSIAEKQEILLYLIHPDGMVFSVARQELDVITLLKPYPLIFRDVFLEETEIMEREGGLEKLQVVKEDFFENGLILEQKAVIFGQPVTSLSELMIQKSGAKSFIYTVSISASELLFEDYRLVANHIIESIK